MKNSIALALLVSGVCISATAGSRLGAEQATRTPLSAQADVAGGIVAKVARCEDSAAKAELRIARELAAGTLTPPDAAAQRAEIDPARLECRDKAAMPWNSDLEGAEQALADATSFLDSRGRLEPTTRLREWFSKGGLPWFGGLLLVVAGAVLGRRAAYERATAPAHGNSNVLEFDIALEKLRASIATLLPATQALADGDDAPELRATIEGLETDIMTPVVEDRGRYQARHGVAVFAEYFGPFSAGERNLARAWSALTDGYPHVAVDALQAADIAFSQAQTEYARVVASK